MPKIEESALRRALECKFNVTIAELARQFDCATSTVERYLAKYGLRTLSRTERRGALNGNGGIKSRPWLEGENHPWSKWHKAHPDFGVKQKGEANPIHRVKHLYTDVEYVSRITRGIRAHVEAKTGRSYEEVYGLEKTEEYKEKLRAASPARMAKFERRVTAPERIVQTLLERLEIRCETQVAFGPYTVDFYVPEYNLVVQVDGDFWHANPSIYPDEKLSKVQRKQRRLDASCNAFLTNRGVKCLRLWEKDLYYRIEWCAAEIMRMCTND